MKMNICKKSRDHISNNSYSLIELANIYLGEVGLFYRTNLNGSKQSVQHIQNCEGCRAWLKNLIPVEVFKRHSRIYQYCCPSMYKAVEKKSESGVNLKIRSMRGEKLWFLEQPEKYLRNEFISYCPWCGTKLPDEPFIADDKE